MFCVREILLNDRGNFKGLHDDFLQEEEEKGEKMIALIVKDLGFFIGKVVFFFLKGGKKF